MMEFLLLPVLLCFLRVSAFVAFLPPFGGQHIPNTVKIGLALALTGFWLPRAIPMPSAAVFRQTLEAQGSGQGITDPSQESSSVGAGGVSVPAAPPGNVVVPQTPTAEGSRRWLLWAWLAAREVLLGAGLGWLLGMILIPMRIAGTWLAEQMGLSMASVTTGTDTGSGNVLAVILELCGVLLLYSMSIHHDFLRIFDRFFDQFQVGQMWSFPEVGGIIATLTRLPERGLAIAAPLAVVFFLNLIVLLFAMKQSPQFNLFTFGMPFRLASGLIAMVVMFPDVLFNAAQHLQGFLLNPV